MIPEDVLAVASYVLSHRIISKGAESFADAKLYLNRMIETIPVPMEN